MKIIKDTKFTKSMKRGRPKVGMRPMKLDKIDSPSRTGRADSAKDIRKFEELL
jgi:hypothetical protein